MYSQSVEHKKRNNVIPLLIMNNLFSLGKALQVLLSGISRRYPQ